MHCDLYKYEEAMRKYYIKWFKSEFRLLWEILDLEFWNYLNTIVNRKFSFYNSDLYSIGIGARILENDYSFWTKRSLMVVD